MHGHTPWPGLPMWLVYVACSRCSNDVLTLRLIASMLCKSQSRPTTRQCGAKQQQELL